MLRQHRRLFGDLSAASDVNEQSCFVSDIVPEISKIFGRIDLL